MERNDGILRAIHSTLSRLGEMNFNGSIEITFHQGEIRLADCHIRGNSYRQIVAIPDIAIAILDKNNKQVLE